MDMFMLLGSILLIIAISNASIGSKNEVANSPTSKSTSQGSDHMSSSGSGISGSGNRIEVSEKETGSGSGESGLAAESGSGSQRSRRKYSEAWVSNAFVLASKMAASRRSNVCWEYNDYFCFIGLMGNPPSSHKRSRNSTDEQEFTKVLKPIYTMLNWYTLDKSGGCCNYQFQIYKKWGQHNGPPDAYLNAAFNLQSLPGRHLNYLVAEYNKQLCYNEIVRIGFGTGGFKRHGGIQYLDYILPPMGNYGDIIVTFSYHKVTEQLNFDWFKLNVLCADQEWICDLWPPRNQLKLKLPIDHDEKLSLYENP